MLRITTCTSIALLLTTPPHDAFGQARPPANPPAGGLRVVVALVDGEMQVRPVPLHTLIIISEAGDTTRTRTSTSGEALVEALPPGRYALESLAAVDFQGKRYRWVAAVDILPSRAIDLELSNDNAVMEAVATVGDDPDPAGRLFIEYQRSVIRVEAGLAHGTGFFADTLGGVILTNAHVVEGVQPEDLSVALDSMTRVPARVLAVDSDADVAVLQVHPSHVMGRRLIPLQQDRSGPLVTPGERLVAMGFPLSQELTVTSGIASSVRAGAVISDVNINPGNSGGPLLNRHGAAIAINTFGEGSRSAGPGVSGSILVSRAGPALARASGALTSPGHPDGSTRPVMPTTGMSIGTVRAISDTADIRRYRRFSDIGVSGFDVSIQTPVQLFVAMRAFDEEMSRDRRRREAQSGVPESERYSGLRDYRDWGEYVGMPTRPVLGIHVRPKVGETTGSIFARVLLAPNMQATYKFRGDVRGVAVFRNRERAVAIKGGHTPIRVYEENRWVSLKDVADEGFYVFSHELFRPDLDGVPPSIVIAIHDLKNPRRMKCRELNRELVAAAWNDFAEFIIETQGREAYTRADHRAARGLRHPAQSGFLKDECDWSY